VQYLSDLYASVAPEVKMLRRFTKVEIAPGEAVQLKFTLGLDDMLFVGNVRSCLLL